MTFRAALKRLRDGASSPWGSVLRVGTDAPEIALTFDDGPDEAVTPQVFEALAAHGGTATFFMLAGRAVGQPALVREAVSAGHEVGLHGLDHRRLTTLPVAEALQTVATARDRLEQLAGSAVTVFRPPYGAQSLGLWRGVRRLGLEVVLWGPSLWDWKEVPQADRLQRALDGAGPGAIVLAHDGLAGPQDGAEPVPVPALDRGRWAGEMLTRYAALGLRSVTVSSLLASGPAVKAARFPS